MEEQLRLHKLWLKGEEGGIRLDLSGKDLSDADLSDADLRYAKLSNADLSAADLSGAVLSDADLIGADLSGADLRWCIGNNKELKTLQLGKYQVTYSEDTMAIGCEQHTIEEWFSFDNETIEAMDTGALAWWNEHKTYLKEMTNGLKETTKTA